MPIVSVIIPAFNEEHAVAHVIKAIPSDIVDEIIVVDNASTDTTTDVATRCGATVLHESRKGYGYACLKGIDYLKKKNIPPNIVVFLDADYSDYPEDMPSLISAIMNQHADLVIGSRVLGKAAKGSMTMPQKLGNMLATFILRLLYGAKFTDLGPFRAIRYTSLLSLDMQDKTYGWTVEMQIKAIQRKMRCLEVSVHYRKRIGQSKISGTFTGVSKAGYKILYTLFRYL